MMGGRWKEVRVVIYTLRIGTIAVVVGIVGVLPIREENDAGHWIPPMALLEDSDALS